MSKTISGHTCAPWKNFEDGITAASEFNVEANYCQNLKSGLLKGPECIIGYVTESEVYFFQGNYYLYFQYKNSMKFEKQNLLESIVKSKDGKFLEFLVFVSSLT